MRKTWRVFWNFLNKRINKFDQVCDNIDSATIEGNGALADVTKNMRIKEEV